MPVVRSSRAPRRLGRGFVAVVAAMAIAPALGGCGEDVLAAPATERLSVRIDRDRAIVESGSAGRPRWDLDGTWVLEETRVGARGVFGERTAFPLPFAGEVEIASAFAAEADAPLPHAGTRVERELRLVADGRDELLAREEVELDAALHAWSVLRARVDVRSSDDAAVVAVARLLGPESAGAGVRPLFATPDCAPIVPERRNVLIVSVDTLRADHLGFHGYARATSPRLDAFVAGGAVFERAVSTSPWTLPSYGTLFTGLAPLRHRAGISARREAGFGRGEGGEFDDFQSLAPDAETLAEILGRAGWITGGFHSNPFLEPASDIARGFDSYAKYMNRAEAGVELATRWIDERHGAPWFLFLHLMDPHAPYTPPAPFDTAFAEASFRASTGYPPSVESLRATKPDAELERLLVDSYDGEIAYTDACIGRLLDFLRERGELERTIVVFHADHGEEFWEHGAYEHGHALVDEVLHVPLAIVAKGLVAPGSRVAARTSTVDVFPTILELAGVRVPEGVDGVGLALALRAGPDRGVVVDGRPCISESVLYGPREWKSWTSATERLVTDGVEARWFELANDPRERTDLAASRAARVKSLRDGLVRRSRSAEAGRDGTRTDFDADRRAELESLGYPGAAPR